MMFKLKTLATVGLLALVATPAPSFAVPGPISPAKRLQLLQQGENAIEIWEPATAGDIADRLLDADPQDLMGVRLKALASFYSGDYDKAKRLADRAAKGDALDPSFLRVIDATWQITQSWDKTESEHFVIHHSPRDAVLAPYALDALEKARTALGKDLGWKSPDGEKVRIEVYPSSDHFARVSTLTRREIQTTGTIALCKFNRLMITTPRALVHGYPWIDTLVHEYTHMVIVKASNNTVPIWLHEGIAKYSETRWRLPPGAEMDVSIESVLAEASNKGHFIEFDRMHPSIAKLPSAWEAHLAFAEVTSAVAFIKERGGEDALSDVLNRMKGGKETKEAVAEVTGVPWKDFDNEWKTYLGEQKLKFRPELEVLPIALKDAIGNDDKDAKEQYHALKDKSRQFMRLGDLLKNENRFDAALIEYRKAQKAQGTHAPMIGHKIGLTLLRVGRLGEAASSLEDVLDLYPDYAPALVDLADVSMQKGDMEAAREFAWKAVTVNPYDPRTHKILAEACGTLGDKPCEKRHRDSLQTLQQSRHARVHE